MNDTLLISGLIIFSDTLFTSGLLFLHDALIFFDFLLNSGIFTCYDFLKTNNVLLRTPVCSLPYYGLLIECDTLAFNGFLYCNDSLTFYEFI